MLNIGDACQITARKSLRLLFQSYWKYELKRSFSHDIEAQGLWSGVTFAACVSCITTYLLPEEKPHGHSIIPKFISVCLRHSETETKKKPNLDLH